MDGRRLRNLTACDDILEEHLEELGFLWEQRERMVFASDKYLGDLAKIESRAIAHLHGLAIGELRSVDLAMPRLEGGGPRAVTAAGFALLVLRADDLDETVLRAFSDGPPGVREGLRIALRHSEVSRLAGRLVELAQSGANESRAAAADVLAFHRLPSPRGLEALFSDPEPHVRVLACGAAGRFGGPWGPYYLDGHLQGDDETLHRAALEASARTGLPDLGSYCRDAASRATPSAAAIEFLGVLGESSDLEFLASLVARSDLALAALRGLGAMGRIEAVPLLLNTMRSPALTPGAVEAFARITGASDTCDAESWWEKEKRRYSAGQRWQFGNAVDASKLGPWFDLLPLAARRDMFFAHRARMASAPAFEIEGQVRLQRR